MIEKIILKKSAVENKMPATEQLEYGEIALNFNTMNPFICFRDTADGIRQIKDYSNEIQNINGALTDAKNEINYLRPLVTDNTKTINVLDSNVSQNSLAIQEVNGVVQNHTDAIATLNTTIEQKADKTDLNTKVDKTDIVQTTGTSTTAMMSQKAVSDIIGNVEQLLNSI